MQAHAMAAAMAAFGQGQNPSAAATQAAALGTQAALGGDGISGGGFDRAPPSNAEDAADASEGAGEKK